MKLSQQWRRTQPVFDETNLVSAAGLVPVMELAERAGLSELAEDRLRWRSNRVASAGANPAGKLTAIVAGMVAGADCIDDLDAIRTGGMDKLFGGVYAPATLGQFLREFTGGHVSQLDSVARGHLLALIDLVPELLPEGERILLDVDSLLRPVYGTAKEGASFGHTKISGRSVLRRGISPLAVTLSTARSTPVVAGIRLRGGSAGSARGAASMVADGARTARAARPEAEIVARGDSAYGNGSVVVACRKAGVRFSLGLARNSTVDAAIAGIPEDAWTPVRYPGAVQDPDTGAWISEAEVAEVGGFTAFVSTKTPATARLVVRRVRDRATPTRAGENGELFPVWRYHPFLTDTEDPAPEADLLHRQHAVVETVFADLIDGPLAHMPSGRFAANAAWTTTAAIVHNLLRAAGTAAGGRHAVARGATLRRQLVNVPARPARPQRRAHLHLPAHWPWADGWKALWDRAFGPTASGPPVAA